MLTILCKATHRLWIRNSQRRKRKKNSARRFSWTKLRSIKKLSNRNFRSLRRSLKLTSNFKRLRRRLLTNKKVKHLKRKKAMRTRISQTTWSRRSKLYQTGLAYKTIRTCYRLVPAPAAFSCSSSWSSLLHWCSCARVLRLPTGRLKLMKSSRQASSTRACSWAQLCATSFFAWLERLWSSG